MEPTVKDRPSMKFKRNGNYSMVLEKQNDWYFGRINRLEAEEILIKNGSTEGLFLVRDSCSSVGDYVLSVVQNSLIVHYQIRRVGDDPFYSIDNGIVVHGLDMLLKHLKELSDRIDSVIILKNHCHCRCTPPDTRRNGRTNLLHRSVISGDLRVVNELLMASNYNIDARNERGQTALHLAVISAEDDNLDIVDQLIKSGANVNARDCETMTALHYCSKLNKPNVAKLLLVEGHASAHCRTLDNGWVALHFAAFLGHSRVISVLLECGAALHPRDSLNETPRDIVERMDLLECKKIFDLCSDRPSDNCPARNQWLWEHISCRYETNCIFEKSGMKNGSFIVRKSKNKANTYVLAMVYDLRVYNYEISRNANFYYIDSGPYWQSLEHLIGYYLNNCDGLPSKLSLPISPNIITCSVDRMHAIEYNTNNNDWNSFDDNTNENIRSILFINNNELNIGNMIGTGEYGDVFKGIWKRANRQTVLVAIKILRKRDMQISRKIVDNFLSEVEVLTSLKHPYIIKLLGVCVCSPLMMIQELAPMGSLLDFLIDHQNDGDIILDMKRWSAQIAIGMSYLESKHFVHRDLAARNILLMSIEKVKIGDFGLSRALKGGSDYYKASNLDRWPIKWYAPESLAYGTFTHASDVWSYGIVLWEMYSFGEQPYDGFDGQQIMKYIEEGKRLSKPDMCSDTVYALMSLCWSLEPKNRPTFNEITQIMFANDSNQKPILNSNQSFNERLKCDLMTQIYYYYILDVK